MTHGHRVKVLLQFYIQLMACVKDGLWLKLNTHGLLLNYVDHKCYADCTGYSLTRGGMFAIKGLP